MFKAYQTGEKIDQPDQQENEKLDKEFLNDFPQFTAHRGDVRALSAFRRKFNLDQYKNLDIFVLMHDGDVSADQVFEKESDVLYFTGKKGQKHALEARGHDAKKSNLERRTEGRADIVIMLNPDIRVTKKLLENVAPGGWVLCRLATANSLRARGTYAFKAVIEKNGENASISRHEDSSFWKSVEVDSEESFREASSLKGGDIVTYAEAKQKVMEAKKAGVPHMSENEVFESYSRLIKIAEENTPGAFARGETLLPCVVTFKDKQIDLGMIDTVLPTKKGENDDKIIVMKKNEFV